MYDFRGGKAGGKKGKKGMEENQESVRNSNITRFGGGSDFQARICPRQTSERDVLIGALVNALAIHRPTFPFFFFFSS